MAEVNSRYYLQWGTPDDKENSTISWWWRRDDFMNIWHFQQNFSWRLKQILLSNVRECESHCINCQLFKETLIVRMFFARSKLTCCHQKHEFKMTAAWGRSSNVSEYNRPMSVLFRIYVHQSRNKRCSTLPRNHLVVSIPDMKKKKSLEKIWNKSFKDGMIIEWDMYDVRGLRQQHIQK